MIIVKVCPCGKGYRAEAWAMLVFKGYQEDEPEPLALRNCTRCGSTIALPRNEDNACRSIAQVAATMKLAMFHARLALVMVRQERVNAAAENRKPNASAIAAYLADANQQRDEASFLRVDLRRLEALLGDHWRAREAENPKARIGRTLVAVDPKADERAKTEPPAAGAR